MTNLVAVAVDECHLVWDWVRFRPKYGELGKLKSVLLSTPFILVSATLTPNVAAYVHKVCRLSVPAVLLSISLRRDNINLVVAQIERGSVDPLLNLIPRDLTDHRKIPKTLIFHDSIDPGIHISNQIRARLPPFINGISSDDIVTCYFGSLDAKVKTKILDDLMDGNARIVVCTDAFGMGIDIPDIEVVIQWGVDERLICSSLAQRIGRAARDPTVEGIAVIYVQRAVFESISKNWREELKSWEEAWEDCDESDHGGAGNIGRDGAMEELEEELEDLCVVPVSKNRQLKRFGLPVRQDNEPKTRKHLLSLYQEAKSLREAFQQARREPRGTRKSPVPMSNKLDPPLLWVLCTQGCRHMVLGFIFKDPTVYERTHRYWCCDWCAWSSGTDCEEIQTAGIPVIISILNPNPPARILVDKASARPGTVRTDAITPQRIGLVRFRLQSLRKQIWKGSDFPDIDETHILSDKALDRLAKNVKQISSRKSLFVELEKAGVRVQYSLLTNAHLEQIWTVINLACAERIPFVPILPKRAGKIGFIVIN